MQSWLPSRLDREGAGVDADEVGIVDAGRRQRLGEGEAGARARRLEIDLPVGDAEAEEPLGPLDRRRDRRPWREVGGEPQRVERRPALAVGLERDAGQPRGLAGLGVGRGTQVGVEPGRDGEVAQRRALAPVVDGAPSRRSPRARPRRRRSRCG